MDKTEIKNVQIFVFNTSFWNRLQNKYFVRWKTCICHALV